MRFAFVLVLVLLMVGVSFADTPPVSLDGIPDTAVGMKLEWDGSLTVTVPKDDSVQPLPLISDYSLSCSACLLSPGYLSFSWDWTCNATPWVSYAVPSQGSSSYFSPPQQSGSGGRVYTSYSNPETLSVIIQDVNHVWLDSCSTTWNGAACP